MSDIEQIACAMDQALDLINEARDPGCFRVETIGEAKREWIVNALLFSIEQKAELQAELGQYKQDVSDAAVEYNEHGSPMAWTGFDRFIITKPDPLAEALLEISGEGGYDNFDHYAYRLRSALEARGVELREIEG